MKVVIVRDAPQKTKKLMAAVFPGQWVIVTVRTDELFHAVSDADVIIPEGAAIDDGLLKQAKNLKLIQTGAGYDNVDVEACTQRGIWVANAAGINARAVAEHVWAFVLCWYKNIIPLNGALKSGRFRVDYQGAELSQKVIGVVGLGSIGREVARLASGFEMAVLGFHHRQMEPEPDIEMVDLDNLLNRSDIVTIHVALNSQTHHMIGNKELGLMKADSFFINTSRGDVVDEAALIEALRQNRIGGAGLDVFADEPLPAESPLCKLDNVILSPHNAGEPDGLFFHKKRFQFFSANIKRVETGKSPHNALNDPRRETAATKRQILEVILPEGYNGKILLVSVSGEGLKKTVLLRSGDLWHREILRNTKTEIKNLGFENARVHELGGALVRFEPDGTITIYGTSEEFGACDKESAASMVKKTFPDRIVSIRY